MSKKTNTAAILAAESNKLTKAELGKLLPEQVQAIFNALPQEQETTEEQTGSKVPQRYRAKYAEQATESGRKAHTYTGKATLNNGDELALLLESASPEETCLVADLVGEQDAGTTLAQYTTDRVGVDHPKTGEPMKALNPGMVRMNAGNRIRASLKAGKTTVAKLTKALKGHVAARPAPVAA